MQEWKETAGYAATFGNTGFNPLPRNEWKHGATDDLCSCEHCSPDGHSRNNPDGVWDTLAVDLATGKTWKVHFPELHYRPRLRARDW